MEKKNNKIKVITPFYNPGEFLENCVNSIISQKYDNFEAIFIDDASTDDSWDKLPHNDSRCTCIRNEENKTALKNIHDAIMHYGDTDPDAIIILVDGDDWLINKKVFSYINDFYNENDPWIMYGQATWTNPDKNPWGTKGIARPYPDEETFNNLRNEHFFVSHIRTFRAGLYQKIEEQDPDFSCMKDKNGQFYRVTYDVAMFFPMMEMAGFEKVFYNDKPLYMYNRDNPLSDDKVRQQEQIKVHQEISQKEPFQKIEE